MSLNLEQATNLIVERARELVNRLIEQRGHDNPPFLPEELARVHGINRIFKTNLGELDAILLRYHDGYVIKVNQNHSLVRQNFSCAHEIGHTLYNELKLDPYIKSIEYRTFNPQATALARARAKERLCQTAASELLMPESVFGKYLEGFGVSLHSIERMADIFRVSVQAATIRTAEVSPEPCISLLWKRQRTKFKTPQLRLSWRVGPGGKHRGKNQYMPLNTRVGYPSSLHKAYEYDSPVKCNRLFRLDTVVKRLPVESKGFGRGETRYVISLAFLDR